MTTPNDIHGIDDKPGDLANDQRFLEERDKQMDDREKEIEAAKAIGMRIARNAITITLNETTFGHCEIWDRDGVILASNQFVLPVDESAAWQELAPRFLTDETASAMLLTEAERLGWEWIESFSDKGHGPQVEAYFWAGTKIYRYIGGNRLRARLEAFLAACESTQKDEVSA